MTVSVSIDNVIQFRPSEYSKQDCSIKIFTSLVLLFLRMDEDETLKTCGEVVRGLTRWPASENMVQLRQANGRLTIQASEHRNC